MPDEDDRHVLACAIKTNANIIVTNNLKDFPEDYLDSFGIKAQKSDDFLTDLIDLNPQQALKAFKEMVLHKRKPPIDEYELLAQYRRIELTNTANYLHTLL